MAHTIEPQEAFVSKLKAQLVLNSWTCADLAARAGIPESHVWDAVESADFDLSLREAVKTAAALGVPLSAMLEVPGE